MIGMICVSENVLNGLGSEESVITVPPLDAGMAKGAVGSTSFCSIWGQV